MGLENAREPLIAGLPTDFARTLTFFVPLLPETRLEFFNGPLEPLLPTRRAEKETHRLCCRTLAFRTLVNQRLNGAPTQRFDGGGVHVRL